MDRKAIKQEAKEILKDCWLKFAVICAIFSGISVVLSLFSASPLLYSILTIAYVVLSIPLGYGIMISFMKKYNKEEVGYFDFFMDGINNFKIAWGITWRRILKVLPYVIVLIICYIALIGLVVGGTLNTISTSMKGIEIDISDVMGDYGLPAIGLGLIILVVAILCGINMLYYVFAEYLLYDNRVADAKEAVEKSKEYMIGKRGAWFVLVLSFFGWLLLADIIGGVLSSLFAGVLGVLAGLITVFIQSFVTAYMQMTYVIAYKKMTGYENASTVTTTTSAATTNTVNIEKEDVIKTEETPETKTEETPKE